MQFEKYTLPNGLQVILHVDRKLPVVHVNQWFHVGSSNERLGRSGFAHLFEHMMFQGSKNASKEYFTYAEAAGANVREGGVNGTTDQDRTNYFATVPSGNLENVLWFESDRLLTLPDALTDAKLANQRDVVRNERRQGLENTPYGRWFKLVAENLFPSRHPYANDVIGMHEDLAAAIDRRRARFLPDLLHAQQPVAGDYRRLRSGGRQAAGREILRHHSCRAAARPAGAQHTQARWREDHRGAGSDAAGADLLRVAHAGLLRAGGRRARSGRRRFSPTACRRG